MKIENDPLITKEELAKRLNKSVRTIDNWMKWKLIPYYKISHTACFRWQEIQDHINTKHRINPKP